ncbi:MAG: DNA polymerase III subunit epsilon [Alphaproteobacteria bacterium]|nr:DNA polymerase III subunit epsilon [Alphaproteobacteria bacterium]
MREICFDTETTGFYPDKGDRVIEIGALELIDHIPTGKIFHEYINPERDVPEEVVKIHGIKTEDLIDKPKFSEIAEKWVEFVGDDGVFVAHNAEFDMKFINFELQKCGYEVYEKERVVDSLIIARKKYPGQHNSLEALCKRFNIDDSARTYHGALLDAQLLSEVYYKLICGEESKGLFTEEKVLKTNKYQETTQIKIIERHFTLSEKESSEHRNFLEKNIKNPIWICDEIK